MFGNNKECASFLVKIAKSKTKNTRGTEQFIYVGCLPCVYSGVWRYLQGCKVAVHVLFTNKHIVKFLQSSAHGEPCKIIYYECK